jgi:hypothetical protein
MTLAALRIMARERKQGPHYVVLSVLEMDAIIAMLESVTVDSGKPPKDKTK